jgi:hypothetical protein
VRSLSLFLVLAAAACGAEPGPAGERSGIAGHVVLVRACPGSMACPPKAVAATVTIQWPDGERVDEVETTGRGRFRVALPPGDYILSARIPTEPDLVPRAAAVTVEPDRFARVRVVIATRLLEP